MKTEHQKHIESFMRKANQDVPEKIIIPDTETRKLRAALILEEALETVRALGFIAKVQFQWNQDRQPRLEEHGFGCDILDVADGCADISVVTIGTLSAFGISDIPILEEVDAANLRKFGEGSWKRDDGKWMKPKDWTGPDIAGRLEEQGFEGSD